MMIELTNDYHRNSVRIRVPQLPATLSLRQTQRVRRTLCGMADCSCGPVRGPQDVVAEWVERTDYGYRGDRQYWVLVLAGE